MGDDKLARAASRFRKEVEGWQRDIEAHESELAESRAYKRNPDLEVTHEYLKDIEPDEMEPGELQSYLDEHILDLQRQIIEEKDDLKMAKDERVEFWRNTFRSFSDSLFEGDENTMELHDRAGYQFKVPTKTEISKVLETLDGSSGEWEMTNLFLFYETLNKMFPDRVRQVKTKTVQKTGKKKIKAGKPKGAGCFGFIFLFALVAIVVSLLSEGDDTPGLQEDQTVKSETSSKLIQEESPASSAQQNRVEPTVPTAVRTWTGKDGRTFLGKVIVIDPVEETIDIERADGQVFKSFPIRNLVESDQIALLNRAAKRED